ncbi:YbgA family protein [Celerinatantimonas yamalensis]|uniref:DUF1722 domain-containing protein n=1 Tax=Celerinatantimonas yamalensis TaxID=559956 RepID=A0ABW9G494_9GAMM
MSDTDQPLNEVIKPRLGVSACTIGEKVRFDGGHKQSEFLLKELAQWVTFVPFCPEVKAGLGVPRPAIRLASIDGQLRVIGSKKADLDVTDALVFASDELVEQASDLTGFVFCAKSPSCGMERVKVYLQSGDPLAQTQSGIFADKLMKCYPAMPCEETGRLNDQLLRESFLCRLFSYARWQTICQNGLTAAMLLDFHQRHKMLLMAHSERHYRQAGPMLSDLKAQPLTELAERYIQLVMDGLRVVATRKKHTNVLMHLQGYFKKNLEKVDKSALTEMILRYQQGLLPLTAPLEMLKHHLRHYPDSYLQLQYYFQPYPEALRVQSVI